jgi:hypothetical protein
MKAEMGSMSKAMIRPCISFNKSPDEQKPRELPANRKQENCFEGTAKKNRKDKVAQRSLVPIVTNEEISAGVWRCCYKNKT